jgi:hypothetical protein
MESTNLSTIQQSESNPKTGATWNRYKPAYFRRRSKTLCASPTVLSESSAEIIARFCWRNLKDDEAVVVLASLLLGWSIPKLLKLNAEDVHQIQGGFYLRSPWKFSDPKLSDIWQALLFTSSEYGLVPIPSALAQRLIKVNSSFDSIEYMEKQVKAYLDVNQKLIGVRPSLSAISRNVKRSANALGLSRAELDFISATSQKDSMQSFYVCFNQEIVHSKLIKYQAQLLDEDLEILELKPFCGNFGSKRALTEAGVKKVFNTHKGLLSKYYQLTQQEFHNTYTSYLIELLHLVTLMRPVNENLVNRSSFTHDFSSVIIEDKGATSLRRVPIPYVVGKILQDYIAYLVIIQTRQQFVYPTVAKEITNMVAGDSPLFQYWDLQKSKMVVADTNAVNKALQNQYPLYRNWHRHSIATQLVKQGECRDSLNVFMGHNPSHDHAYSDYSSLSFAPLKKIGSKIEQLIRHWNVPLLSPLPAVSGR